MGAQWRHLANTIEPSMCSGDAAFLSNYFDHLSVFCSARWIKLAFRHSGSFSVCSLGIQTLWGLKPD